MRDYKPYVAIAITALLASFTFSACTPITTIDQAADSAGKGDSTSTEASDHPNTITPAFFSEIGKTLGELREEYPEGITIVSLDGFPDCAAICFGDPEAEYLYYFFGTQSGDAEKAMNEYEDELKCAGFLTAAGILFPEMDEDMSFEEFFALIGVEDYEYFGEDVITAEGWLRFTYNDMEVMVNTNEPTAGGGWDFTGEEIVKRNAPASIVDPERFNANQDLAETDMFDAQEIDLPLYYPGTSDNTEVKEAIVLRYYGHCRTENGQRIYDISMIYHRPITPEDYEQQYKIIRNFYDLVSHENLQTISYIPPLGMDPGSIKCGLSIVDVNADGYDDFILDLGLFGHVYHSACFVHSPGGTYAEVAGFDNLPYPEYDANDGTFTVEEPGEFGYQKYLIMEDELLPAN